MAITLAVQGEIMMKLVIGNKNYSTWSLRPWLLLDAFQIVFDEIAVSLLQDQIKERLGKYSATNKVPVLIDDDLVVWDSLAICEYISEQYLHGKGWPDGIKERANARSLCAEMHSGFMALRAEMPMNCRAHRSIILSSESKLDIQRIDDIWSCHAKLDADGQLRLFGKFSIADCFFAPVVLRFATYGVSLSAQAQAYSDSILSDRSLQRWIAMAGKETEIVPEDEAGLSM
ncbi:MAG: glutathione S-transferase [Psychromonas sp.]|jgi:glutathione S-transferase|uniref:glutathione S-transferase family protein n=1 Tax=Psychromonas sp. TaxID=1884585 RepID=UPI0039E3259E